MRHGIRAMFFLVALGLAQFAPGPAMIVLIAVMIDVTFSGRLFGTRWAPNPCETRFEESMCWAGYNRMRFQWLFAGRAFKRIESDPNYLVCPFAKVRKF